MNPEELLRLIDVLQIQKDVSKEAIFLALEDALAQGVRKRLGMGEDLTVQLDRKTAEITVEDEEGEYEIELTELGRIAAQAVKQGFFQRLREAERDVLYEEYENRVGTLVNGQVQRYEGQDLVVNLGRAEAYLAREDRVRGETFAPGDRIRGIVVEVRKDGSRVRIQLSRTHPDLVRRLFELEVPEVADEIIQIKRVVREPGYRTKMAVISSDPKIDSIGACVGVRGSRIKAVIDELRGERIDIIRWSDSLETLIMNGLKPASIHLDNIYPDEERHAAIVLVEEDQQSLAIGKRGQNVRLASKLCGWEIDIKTREQYFAGEEGSDPDAETDANLGESTPPSDDALEQEASAVKAPSDTQEASAVEAPSDTQEASAVGAPSDIQEASAVEAPSDATATPEVATPPGEDQA